MMGAPFEQERVPDSAIVDFIAFIVGNGDPLDAAGAELNRLMAVRSLLLRYGKLQVVVRGADTVSS
jgi:hypothetical protein